MAAGLGFKDFVTGEVLTAADVDGYLMQGIWVFASAAARDAAVTSPQEGNACYLKDTNQVLTYSGSAWVAVGGGSPLTTKGDLYGFSTVDARIPIGTNNQVLTADSTQALGLKWATPAGGGKVLQVVSTTYSTSTTIASTTFTDSGLSLSITPTSATSKILVLFSIQADIFKTDTNQAGRIKLLRASTDIWNDGATDGGLAIYVQNNGANGLQMQTWAGINYLDSPSTTSSTTYKVQGKIDSTAGSGQIRFQSSSNTSSMTLLEIGA